MRERRGPIRTACVAAAALVAAAFAATGARAAPEPQPYQHNDPGGFHDILPPGTNGLANAVDLGNFIASGARPPHNDDQLGMYADLIYEAPNLQAADLEKYFKDASFGVRPDDVARTYSPRDDVTIVRDASFGVPHVYGETRSGAMFGLGYIAAEDRLFFIDILRHLGRAQLTRFAGGAEGNRDFDKEQWEIAPYTEADLQRQIDQFDDLYGAQGAQLQSDLGHYVAGVNAYITAAKLNPLMMPGEYAAVNKPEGPHPWKGTDVVATAALVGGIFGKGGGGEVRSAEVLRAFQERFGTLRGYIHWRDFRSAEDPEAPSTVRDTDFPYQEPPARARGRALPDRDTFVHEPLVVGATGSAAGEASARDYDPGILGRLRGASAFPSSGSNALLVSARESESGHPLAVFGPQTGYFSPQILMEQDVHAPTIDARGAAFPGTNIVVQLGRGRDYTWSATSAGQDIVDTFALRLCNTDGSSPATLASDGYMFRGQCTPFEVLERTNSWEPNVADDTPAGSETLRILRTKMGLVEGRALLGGEPFVYTKLRSTYMHEVDSAIGFMAFNDPNAINGPEDFQRAAHDIGYTFNWFYADDEQIAYFNSGDNPIRPEGVDHNFPVRGELEWQSWDPDAWTADFTPFEQHPRVIDQDYLTSWNNKQAPAYRASDNRYNWGPIDRVIPLNQRIVDGTRGAAKMNLIELVNAMEDAGTVDLRGARVLPWALRVMLARPIRSAALRAQIAKMVIWFRSGAHRRDMDRDGAYEHSSAIALMDAWWPRLTIYHFYPVLGKDVYLALRGIQGIDDRPHKHLGSAYDDGWYGFVEKDLRTLVRGPGRVRGAWSRVYCGAGNLLICRVLLLRSFISALRVDPSTLYTDDSLCEDNGTPNSQTCWDSIHFTPIGGITQPLIPWINRPTYQQAVEVQGPRP